MFSKYLRLSGVLSLFLLFPQLISADERQVYVDSVGQKMLTGPHGGVVATLGQGATVSVLEDKDDWVKVSVEGWVRRNALTSRKRTAAKSTGPLTLTDFEVTKEPDSSGAMQVWLKLLVKNNTDKKISSWNAILIVRKRGGQVLFNTRVSDDAANIEPGETGSVRYYWDADEQQYNILLNNPKNSLQLLLHKLQAN